MMYAGKMASDDDDDNNNDSRGVVEKK